MPVAHAATAPIMAVTPRAQRRRLAVITVLGDAMREPRVSKQREMAWRRPAPLHLRIPPRSMEISAASKIAKIAENTRSVCEEGARHGNNVVLHASTPLPVLQSTGARAKDHGCHNSNLGRSRFATSPAIAARRSRNAERRSGSLRRRITRPGVGRSALRRAGV